MIDRDELVARLRNPIGAGIAPTLWLNRAADQIERDGREIERLRAENESLRVNRDFWKARFQIEAHARIRMQEALSDLAANTHLAEGECDWPEGQDPLSRARAALKGEGET